MRHGRRDRSRRWSPTPASFPFVPVEGTGVYEIPVGPVHAGLIEPGHFRFWVVGETILRMKARLWFVHKGIERLFEGQDAAGRPRARRADLRRHRRRPRPRLLPGRRGRVAASRCPTEAQVLRAVLLELERLYNHVADIGALCNDVGFGLANAWALSLREQLLQLNAEVTGHRLLRGGVVPGGARVDSRLPTPNWPRSASASTSWSTWSPRTPWSWSASPAPPCSTVPTPATSASSASPAAPRVSPSTPDGPPVR